MYFVHPDALADEAQPIINGMAATFVANNFEIAPVLRQLFLSEHFLMKRQLALSSKALSTFISTY